MFSDKDRHKKARRACAMRAFRTSSDDSGNHRWRILVELAGVEPASEMLQLFVFIEIMLANKIRVAFAYPL